MAALAFCPNDYGLSTVELSVSGTTSNVALNDTANGASILLSNVGDQDCFIVFGTSAVTASVPNGATNGGFPVLANSQTLTTVPGNTKVTHVAAITASSTTKLYITTGQGL